MISCTSFVPCHHLKNASAEIFPPVVCSVFWGGRDDKDRIAQMFDGGSGLFAGHIICCDNYHTPYCSVFSLSCIGKGKKCHLYMHLSALQRTVVERLLNVKDSRRHKHRTWLFLLWPYMLIRCQTYLSTLEKKLPSLCWDCRKVKRMLILPPSACSSGVSVFVGGYVCMWIKIRNINNSIINGCWFKI